MCGCSQNSPVMNLHYAPSSNAQLDIKTLRVMLQERDDIIKNLKKQQALIKKTILDNTTQMQDLANDLCNVKQELTTAKSDAERWKIEAFQSVQQTAINPEEIKQSAIYRSLETQMEEIKEEIKQMKIKHSEELNKKEEEYNNQLESFRAEARSENQQISNQVQDFSSKKMKELEQKIKELQLALEQRNERNDEDERNEQDERSTYDKTAVHMLEQQLRRAEEHVLEQSELYQRAVMQLELEVDRRNKCRKCRKQAAKEKL